MAQLVAHHTGSVGVTGSSPVSSTISDVLEHLTSVEAGVGARAANGSASLIVALSSSLISMPSVRSAALTKLLPTERQRLRSPACELLAPDQTADLSGRWAGLPSPNCAGDEAATIDGVVRCRGASFALGAPALS